jgi:hypothetical protein
MITELCYRSALRDIHVTRPCDGQGSINKTRTLCFTVTEPTFSLHKTTPSSLSKQGFGTAKQHCQSSNKLDLN